VAAVIQSDKISIVSYQSSPGHRCKPVQTANDVFGPCKSPQLPHTRRRR